MQECRSGDEKAASGPKLRLLAVTQGHWGERIAMNIANQAPVDWEITTWAAPRPLPPVIDDPQEFLPKGFEKADMLLALGDQPGLSLLVPEIARLAGVQAVIAPIDRLASMPEGLACQLQGWLEAEGVAAVFPKPFCSLTPKHFNRTPLRTAYDQPLIHAFAAHFGQPSFELRVEAGIIQEISVRRAAAWGRHWGLRPKSWPIWRRLPRWSS